MDRDGESNNGDDHRPPQCFIVMKGIELMTAVSGMCCLKKLSVHTREHVQTKSRRNKVAHAYHIRTTRGKYSICWSDETCRPTCANF